MFFCGVPKAESWKDLFLLEMVRYRPGQSKLLGDSQNSFEINRNMCYFFAGQFYKIFSSFYEIILRLFSLFLLIIKERYDSLVILWDSHERA